MTQLQSNLSSEQLYCITFHFNAQISNTLLPYKVIFFLEPNGSLEPALSFQHWWIISSVSHSVFIFKCNLGMSVSLSPFLNVITGTENRNSQTSLNWNLDGPFQNVDNVAQHCEIHSKDFLKENVHNFGKKTRLNWNMDHSKYSYCCTALWNSFKRRLKWKTFIIWEANWIELESGPF